MFKDLIAYEDLQEACAEMFGFSDVKFIRDFDPWKAGDEVDSLWFNLEDSVVEEQSNEGGVIKKCYFQLVAKVQFLPTLW